jgi:hypothetical protein
LAGLIILLLVLVNLTPVQNFLARKATEILADKLKTTVGIKNVRIDFLNHVLIEGLYIEDKNHDTLLYAGQARVRITDWFILRKSTPVIHYVGLHDAYAHLYRTAKSDEWNYQFIADAFDSGPSTGPKKESKNDFDISLEKVDLQNVRFHMDDAWVGGDMDFDVGSFVVDAKKIDFNKKIIDFRTIEIIKTAIVMRDYDGGRPPRPKKVKVLDTTAFNPDNWSISAGKLYLDDCIFKLDSEDDIPVADEFDPTHMNITGIKIDARNLIINGDTLRAKLDDMTATERCGIRIKKAKADVTVSPNAAIADNLYLETNNSILRRYYAMHYTRFPDFEDYIDKVIMVGDLRDAIIDANDVGYFAPPVRQFKTRLHANGQVGGTVDSIVARNMNINDGASTIKGNLKMNGLPDINTTWIEYTNGEIMTGGAGVLKYVPDLRNNPNLAIEQLTHAYFKGNFVGYIENFATNGVLVTNLGTITSDVKMKMPGMKENNAVYSGVVATENFNLGTLLRQPDLGILTFKSKITGNAFDPKYAKVQINAEIEKFEFRKYPYHNILADGLLERNKFNGNVLVDDPNLALAFYGDIDFNQKQLAINAKANLLKSNLTALKLTTDSITAVADFDLDWVGNSIDSFNGYARLYNINVVRNNHRLDLDSVYVRSSGGGDNKLLNIESNALQATVKGDYVLSNIPRSVQFYISGYLPNYIKAPVKYSGEQNFSFDVVTKEVDSLLGVIIPDIKGFNNATIKGSLNTLKQQLSLRANIPYGKISDFTLYNASITSDGNFKILGINAEADRVVVGDSTLNGSISITTSIGNDSLLFNIATFTDASYGTATVNGRAYASGDSLFINLLPSEFYLKKQKWEIPGGSRIDLSKDYLYVQNLKLTTGPQKITVDTKYEQNKDQLVINTTNLDIAQIGALAGISEYQPDGRVSGSIKINDLFKDFTITTNLQATDVKFGTDTIGNVIVAGNYNAKNHKVNIDPSTGIYRGSASLNLAGNMVLFDSTSNQKLDGTITLNNAPLSWTSPLLEGYVSDISGALTGKVKIGGTAANPDMDGSVQLDNAAMHVDFLGTNYNIHTATITVDNKEINLGNINLYDGYKNSAILAGRITHERFKNLRLAINMGSSKFQVINLKDSESEYFYGNLIVGFQNLSVTGPVDDIRIRITKARPADKSHLYIPIGSTGAASSNSYSYVSFKTYGTDPVVVKKKPKNKLNISIDAILNSMAEVTLVLDPSTGDAINATGSGNLSLEIPMDNDIKMYGIYDIEKGDYTFTLKQLFFKRRFDLNEGSRISFNGPIGQTEMNVEGVYTARARLYDLLSSSEKTAIESDPKEASETKAAQNVNILMNMRGSLAEPRLTFKLDLPDKRAAGTLAYNKLQSYNQDEKQLFQQVASLLLIGSFIPGDDGAISGGNATAGAISNISEMFSGTASSQLTNLISKLTGDKNLSFNLKYKTYNINDISSSGGGGDANSGNLRNELSFGVSKNYFNDRLTLDVGSSLDWGRPTATSSKNNFNPVGDFRVQYQFKEGGNLRGYIFRTSNFDVLQQNNISRGGVGISWRKSFDNLEEFFRGAKYARKKLEEQQEIDSARGARVSGTN